ncbi:MAG: GGDEF domain-containing phosphodiesterase, partial [Beijerinckiaceae bacterium]|nr:GGDEF domain-containing phosphodiesterase [Beijerinckiaceae bacterium]
NAFNARSSIGAALFPDHQRDLPRLLQSADSALRVAKNAGRDTISLFSAQNAREAERRVRETQALKIGLARNDILAFYQPVFNLQTGEVVSVEALARWRHPSKGFLAANYFQSAFENSETAADITEAMLRAIAADARMWSAEGIGGLRVSLNLAESELRRADIADRFLNALAAASFPLSLLEVEAPESALVRSDASVLAALERMKQAGVRIALDNFGKTNASLSILRAMPFDHLKIDRSLIAGIVKNPACAAIVTSLIGLAQSMNMDVTAEGVETIHQLEKLRSLRRANVQGYLLGAPMVAARLPEFMRKLRGAQAAGESYSLIEEPDPFGPTGPQTR